LGKLIFLSRRRDVRAAMKTPCANSRHCVRILTLVLRSEKLKHRLHAVSGFKDAGLFGNTGVSS